MGEESRSDGGRGGRRREVSSETRFVRAAETCPTRTLPPLSPATEIALSDTVQGLREIRDPQNRERKVIRDAKLEMAPKNTADEREMQKK